MKKLLVVLLLISTFSMNLFAEPVVGHKAPSIEFSASLDMRISQRDFLGKVLILDFWATSCVPCIASFPKLNSLIKEADNNPNIMFLSITSENKELVEDFIRKRNIVLDAIKLIDSDNATTNNFEINGLPETFVIDKSGVIRWIGRIDDLNVKMLKSLSEENISNALFADFNNINQNRSGMSFYINNVSNGYNSYTSFYDYKLKYWKFNTDGSNIIDIIKGIAMPRLEADIQFLNPEAAKDKNYVLRFRLDIQLMNVRQKQYFQDRVLPNSIHENYLLELLKGCGVNAIIKDEERIIYYLEIQDKQKLESFISTETHNLSLVNNQLENEFEFKNTLLSGIAEKSSSFGIIIRDSTNEKRRFNLKLNGSSYESLENSLGDCGLKLRKETGVVKVLKITFQE